MIRALSLFAALALVSPAPAQEPKKLSEEVQKAKDKLAEFLKATPGAEAGRVAVLTDGAATFPDHTLFSLVFPQFPVAREAPAPFKSANVIAVPKKKDAKPVVMTIELDLETFLKDSGRPVKTAAEAEEAIKFWVRAHAELRQDGFFTFVVTADAAKVESDGGITATARAAADPKNGDMGEVKATITFRDGKQADTATKVNLKAGMRPRCQATKLLDADPIVRLMAEDSLRVMGRSAKPYLDEQRAKANAELREAIDRVWAKIVAEGR